MEMSFIAGFWVVSFLLIGGFLAVIPDHYQRFRLA